MQDRERYSMVVIRHYADSGTRGFDPRRLHFKQTTKELSEQTTNHSGGQQHGPAIPHRPPTGSHAVSRTQVQPVPRPVGHPFDGFRQALAQAQQEKEEARVR